MNTNKTKNTASPLSRGIKGDEMNPDDIHNIEQSENEEIANDPELADVEQEEDELFEHYRFVIDKGQEPLRIDKFLSDRIVNVSRNKIQNAAEVGSILVNKKPVKSNYKVKGGDLVQVVLPNPVWD